MKDICIQCGLEMKVGQVGIAVVQLYMNPPEPYTLTYADTRECPNCHREVVCPSSAAPTIEHHDPRFSKEIAKALYLAETGKLRIIEVYERVNMALPVRCEDCLYWAAERLPWGRCREAHAHPYSLTYQEGERLCTYYQPRREA
jgi:hypothetical protein